MYRDQTMTAPEAPTPAGPVPTVFEAIVKQLCLNASWNRAPVVLAPHILYTRHGELFVDAVTVARDNMLAREPKLGTFKLAGLGDLKLSNRSFERSDLFEPEAEKYAGVTLMNIEG